MTLRVRTSRVTYVGADRLDVTRKGADEYLRRTGETWEGEPFAPSWAILGPALRARQSARCGSPVIERAALAASTSLWWGSYVKAYVAEMRASYRRQRDAWDNLIARKRVTLVCYCADEEHCHRVVLARDILPKLGARYDGEVQP